MLEHTKAVIFDLDGTLVDSMWVWTAIDEDYIRKYHLNPPEDFHEAMEGMSYTETAQYFLKIFPELPHTVEEIKKEWYDMSVDKYTKEVTLKPGVKEFLEMLKEKGIRTGIATSNDRKLVEEFLKARQITHLFDTICTSCEVKKGKPAPDVYLKAAGQLGAEPSAWYLKMFRWESSPGKMQECVCARWTTGFHAHRMRKSGNLPTILFTAMKTLPIRHTRYYNESWIFTDQQERDGRTGVESGRLCLCKRRCLCRPPVFWTCDHHPPFRGTWLPRGDHCTA